MSFDLETIGITNEELVNRVVNTVAQNIMTSISFDEDGDEWRAKSDVAKKLDEVIKKTIDGKVSSLAEKHILPNVNAYIETLTLQSTNQWGEKTGQKITFIEYLTKRAEAYMVEEVNFEGKSKAECGSYSFTKAQTRLANMIDKHLQYSISVAMKDALTIANSAISEGIAATVRAQLSEIVSKLKTEVKVR